MIKFKILNNKKRENQTGDVKKNKKVTNEHKNLSARSVSELRTSSRFYGKMEGHVLCPRSIMKRLNWRGPELISGSTETGEVRKKCRTVKT